MRVLVVAMALVTFCASVQAQQPAPLVELANSRASIAALGITVEQAIGSDVYDVEGNQMGTVIRVLGDDADSSTALVLDAEGTEVTVKLLATELIENRIVASRSGLPIEHKAPFE
ncbi:MAG: hypothetical protein P0Y65_15950 [Candidatus Devosia phytovorans]|uniref:PRC-barrel domain-containing protein n=1 Tax=Candidatus Devosia phytovorans TaxID=3121372 RepID=A0AAJ5VT42_9HYPH|nr:hypothetical protein [Devosia sp.]WEK03670.1 MAG: hypothetical protein P0Y65_15950 [Devosia sp.]